MNEKKYGVSFGFSLVFFVTLASPNLLALFFVTLEEIAGFLCIKALQRIEKFGGYDLETVLNSLFCYKLPERAPDSEPPPVSELIIECKGTTLF